MTREGAIERDLEISFAKWSAEIMLDPNDINCIEAVVGW
jgi:hypothetical protein